jgi:hypothetical protein
VIGEDGSLRERAAQDEESGIELVRVEIDLRFGVQFSTAEGNTVGPPRPALTLPFERAISFFRISFTRRFTSMPLA